MSVHQQAQNVQVWEAGLPLYDFEGQDCYHLVEFLQRTTWMGTPQWAMEVMLTTKWIWKVKYETKEDYSQALRSDETCPTRFWTCLGPIVSSFLLISFFWNGNVYLLPLPPLYFGSIQLVWVTWLHWRRIFPQEELYLKSHSYLIQKIFRWDFGH